jgi:hypothetical protein
MLGGEKTNLAVRAADADQHAAGGGERGQQRGVDLDIGRRRRFIPPERNFIANCTKQRSATHRSKTVGMNRDGDAVAQRDRGARLGDHLTGKRRARSEEAFDVGERRRSLIHTRRQNQAQRLFPRRHLERHEQREIHGEQGGDPALARSASRDRPQLANPLRRWLAPAGNGVEQRKLIRRELQRERCLEKRKPHQPR